MCEPHMEYSFCRFFFNFLSLSTSIGTSLSAINISSTQFVWLYLSTMKYHSVLIDNFSLVKYYNIIYKVWVTDLFCNKMKTWFRWHSPAFCSYTKLVLLYTLYNAKYMKFCNRGEKKITFLILTSANNKKIMVNS